MALAMAVPSRLWPGGIISPHRDRILITTPERMARAASSCPAILVCVDGLASNVTAFARVFRGPQRTGRGGRPRLVPTAGLPLGQLIEHHATHQPAPPDFFRPGYRRVIGIRWHKTDRDQVAHGPPTEAGNAFLQPRDLPVEPPDPLVEFGLEHLVVVVAADVAEEGLGVVEELLLPRAGLDGVELMRLGQFGDCLDLLGGLLGNFGIGRGRMPLACASRDSPRDGSVMFDQFNIPRCPRNGLSRTFRETRPMQ